VQFEFSEQERMIAATVRRAFQGLAPAPGRDAQHPQPEDAIAATLAELGILRPAAVDVEDDPLASLRVAHIVAVEAGRACIAYPILERLVTATLTARSSALRGLLRDAGARHVAVAGAGTSRGRRAGVAGGRATGTIPLVTFAQTAHLVLAPADEGPAELRRSVVVAVDPGQAAACLLPRTSAEPPYPVADIRVDGVPVVGAKVVAVLDDGSSAAGMLELIASLLAAAEICGACTAAFDLAREHLCTRRQFDLPLGANQALRHIMADNYVRLVAMGAAVEYAVLALDAQAQDAEVAVRSAKHYASVAGKALAEDMLQMHGAIGFTSEYTLGRFMRRILRLCAMHGAPRAQEEHLYAALAIAAGAR